MAEKRVKTGGRKKGTPNKRTQAVQELLESMDCDPIAGMARIAAMAETDAQAAGEPKDRLPHMNLVKDCYKELAQYVAPKRKAVEHTGEVGTVVRLVDLTGDDG